jgi:hypothetical protein
MPIYLQVLGWEWETAANALKLLGFPMAQSISKEQMSTMLLTKLEANLEKSHRNPASLMARVTAHHYITATFWYMLTLWVGDAEFLTEMQHKVTSLYGPGKERRPNTE